MKKHPQEVIDSVRNRHEVRINRLVEGLGRKGMASPKARKMMADFLKKCDKFGIKTEGKTIGELQMELMKKISDEIGGANG